MALLCASAVSIRSAKNRGFRSSECLFWNLNHHSGFLATSRVITMPCLTSHAPRSCSTKKLRDFVGSFLGDRVPLCGLPKSRAGGARCWQEFVGLLSEIDQ